MIKKFVLLFSLLMPFYCYAQQNSRTSFSPDDADFYWAVNLLKITFEQEHNNFVVSPLSIYAATTLLANGADGNTLNELTNMLTVNPKTDLQSVNNAVRSYITHKKDSIQIVNSISGKVFRQDYIDEMQRELFAQFDNEISDEDKSTLGLKEEEPEGFVLKNVVDFKAKWERYFGDSRVSTFYSLDGNDDKVDLMPLEKVNVDYFQNDIMQAIRLPYKDGNVMHIFLPDVNVDFCKFIKSLSAGDLYLDYFKTLADVYIPKFEIDYEAKDIISFYKRGGVKDVFNRTANLSKLSDLPHYVDKIIHKTRIKTDEEGTEAHAETIIPGITLGMSSVEERPRTIKFVADHPFIFMINNGDFIGVYTKGSRQPKSDVAF